MGRLSVVTLLCLLGTGQPVLASGSNETPSCGSIAGFHALDFCVGSWRVESQDGELVGTNRIEKILSGCAVVEHWAGVGGGKGQSLFFYTPAVDEWNQVWVTSRAARPGGVKQKKLVQTMSDGGVRFQGEIVVHGQEVYLDRTTLTPLSDGRVRQHIEVSRDGGESWQTTFDAIYVPVDRAQTPPERAQPQ